MTSSPEVAAHGAKTWATPGFDHSHSLFTIYCSSFFCSLEVAMLRDIRRVAVLGAGTMGARIAAHLANANIPSVLLDIVPKELTPEEQRKSLTPSDPRVRNRIAQAGLDSALKSRPAAFFVPEATGMITI